MQTSPAASQNASARSLSCQLARISQGLVVRDLVSLETGKRPVDIAGQGHAGGDGHTGIPPTRAAAKARAVGAGSLHTVMAATARRVAIPMQTKPKPKKMISAMRAVPRPRKSSSGGPGEGADRDAVQAESGPAEGKGGERGDGHLPRQPSERAGASEDGNQEGHHHEQRRGSDPCNGRRLGGRTGDPSAR